MKSIFHYIFLPVNFLLLKLNGVRFGRFRIFGMLTLQNKGSFTIGDNFRVNSGKYVNVIGGSTRTSFVVRRGARMQIGKEVSISNSAFYCAEEIVIEDYVMIGGGCRIWDCDFHPMDPDVRKRTPNDGFAKKPIRIKESAFIGGGSIILKGVTIGKNSIVGAGSVVSKSIPDNEIWAGNPARFIKKLNQ